MMSVPKNKIPLSELGEYLRARAQLSQPFQQLLDESPKGKAMAAEVEDQIKQFAIILKAADLASDLSDHPANFKFAAGFIGASYLGEADYLKAKAIAATL